MTTTTESPTRTNPPTAPDHSPTRPHRQPVFDGPARRRLSTVATLAVMGALAFFTVIVAGLI